MGELRRGGGARHSSGEGDGGGGVGNERCSSKGNAGVRRGGVRLPEKEYSDCRRAVAWRQFFAMEEEGGEEEDTPSRWGLAAAKVF